MKWHSIQDKRPEDNRRIAIAYTYNGIVHTDVVYMVYEDEAKILSELDDDERKTVVFLENGDVGFSNGSLYCRMHSRFEIVSSETGILYSPNFLESEFYWTYG